jgi:hypothetical protein
MAIAPVTAAGQGAGTLNSYGFPPGTTSRQGASPSGTVLATFPSTLTIARYTPPPTSAASKPTRSVPEDSPLSKTRALPTVGAAGSARLTLTAEALTLTRRLQGRPPFVHST